MNNENKSESHAEISDQKKHKNYILKILFGPMYGCELQLPADDYFLIINSSSQLLDDSCSQDSHKTNSHAISYALNSLYIPCHSPSANLILKLSQPISHEEPQRFSIQVNDTVTGMHSLFIDNNTLFTYENIKFAIKEEDESWSEEIISSPTNKNNLENADNTTCKKTTTMGVNKKIFIATSILIAFICILITLLHFNKDEKIKTLNQALIGAPNGFQIVSDSNQKVYILTENQRVSEWIKEALIKLGDNKNIIVDPIYIKSKELVTELNLSGYPILRFDYSDPKKIKVLLFNSLSDSKKSVLQHILADEFPFSSSFIFVHKPKIELISEAKQGLERLNIHFKQINTASGYGFIIRDALSDNALNALNNFINDFQKKWGGNFITFSVHLEENWLQNKSYVDSNNGYLFLNPRHWYFPIKNKEF